MRHPVDLAARRERRRLAAAFEREVDPPHEGRRDDRAEHDEARGRMDDERRDDGNERGTDRRDERDDDAHLDVDLVVQVAHDAGEKVGAALRAQARRGERHELAVGRGSTIREIGQRGVVGDESLDVAENRAPDTERAHGDDGGEQGEDDGALAGAHDEPARRSRQRNATRERERTDEPGERHAAHRLEQRASLLRFGGHAVTSSRIGRAVRRHWLSARAASSSSCVTTTTGLRAASATIASRMSAALAGSR